MTVKGMVAPMSSVSVASADIGAGLVPSKTSPPSGLFVNLAPSAVAERRVKRLKKSVWASGHLHGMAENGFRAAQCWFVTLTYRGVSDWSAKHISAAIELFRKWCKRVGVPCRYTWVAELQHRGAVHYHLLCWLPQGRRMPQWDRTYGRLSAFWPHGMSNTQVAKAGVGYLMKYLSKLGELSRFPKGLRLYGIGGLNECSRSIRSWLNFPEWVKRSFGVGEVKRGTGGFVVRSTGEFCESPYQVQRVPAGFILLPYANYRRDFIAGRIPL